MKIISRKSKHSREAHFGIVFNPECFPWHIVANSIPYDCLSCSQTIVHVKIRKMLCLRMTPCNMHHWTLKRPLVSTMVWASMLWLHGKKNETFICDKREGAMNRFYDWKILLNTQRHEWTAFWYVSTLSLTKMSAIDWLNKLLGGSPKSSQSHAIWCQMSVNGVPWQSWQKNYRDWHSLQHC